MKYLRSVRVDENDARDSEMLRRRGFLDPTGPKALGKSVNIQRKLGNTEQAEKLKKQGRTAKEALRTPLAPAKTARQRYTLAELQPKKESFIPLTLPSIMEGFKKPTRMPGTGPYMPQGDKIRMPANRKPMPKKKIKPGNVKNKKGGSQTTDEEDNITKWRS